jgi:protein-glutamine gamma-glutamyltransferase
MNLNYEDGIIMDNTILIIDEKKSGFPLSTRIFQFLVIAIGSWGGISMLIDSIGLPSTASQINGAILVFSALFYALCLHPSYGLVKLFFSVLCYGLFLYSRLTRLLNGFYIVENQVLRHISSYYGTTPIKFKADYSMQEADTSLLLIMILIPTIGLLSLAVIRNLMVWLAAIVMFLPVSACFVLGLIPAEHYLVAYAVCLLYLTRSGYNYYHSTEQQQKKLLHRISSRAAIWLSLLSLCLFFLIKAFVSREDYDNMVRIKEVKAEIQAAMNDFSIEDFSRRLSEIKLFTRKVSSTGLNGGELGKTGQVQYQNTKHLTITAPRQSIDEGIYLKGYVGSVYTGDRWEKHSEEMQKEYEKLLQRLPLKLFPPVNQMNLFLEHFIAEDTDPEGPEVDASGWYDYRFDQGTMKIEYRGANTKYLYAPYFTDYSALSNILYEQDLYASPAIREESYEYQYYFNVTLLNSPDSYESLLNKLSDYSEYEKLYREYVHRAYTILPEGLINIKRDFAPSRVMTRTGSVTEKIAYVKSYLEENTQYSLTPGKLPEGEDFVEYFIYQNKVGYCAHYASAATLMLRTLGIPARYVEGYAIGAESIYRNTGTQETTRYTNVEAKSNTVTQCEVNVMDYHAHAWVEVYFDNCGWIPVEFTPGSAVDYNETVVADMEEFSTNIEDGNIRKSLEESSVVPTPVLEIPVVPQPVNEPQNEPGSEEHSRGTGGSDFLFLGILLGVSLIIMVAFVIFRIRRTEQARHSKNYNQRAIFYYREIEKLFKAGGGLPGKEALLEESEAYIKEHYSHIEEAGLDQLMEIVRKARFGRGEISSEELKQVISFRESVYRMLYKELSPRKRICLKFNLLL